MNAGSVEAFQVVVVCQDTPALQDPAWQLRAGRSA
jgi:hypothetical protein